MAFRIKKLISIIDTSDKSKHYRNLTSRYPPLLTYPVIAQGCVQNGSTNLSNSC